MYVESNIYIYNYDNILVWMVIKRTFTHSLKIDSRMNNVEMSHSHTI